MHDAIPRVVRQTVANHNSAAFQRPAQAVDCGVETADALLGGRDEKDNLHG
jgi:hypothetical protein